MSSDALHFEAVGVEKKYQKLIWAGLLFIVLGLAVMVCTFAYFHSQGAYEEGAPQTIYPMLPILLIFIPGYGYRIFMQGLTEWRLFKRTELSGLKLDKDMISGPVLLLEGIYRERLLQRKAPAFHFEWDDINNFILEPVRGSKGYGSPPYYKLTFKERSEKAESSCFIMRECFKADEAEIVKFVTKRLGKAHVVNNDPV